MLSRFASLMMNRYWPILCVLAGMTVACGRVGYGALDQDPDGGGSDGAGPDGGDSPAVDAAPLGDGVGLGDAAVGDFVVRAIIDGTSTNDDGMIYASSLFESGQPTGFLPMGRTGSSVTWNFWRLRFQEPLPANARLRSAGLRLWGGGMSADWDTTSDGLMIFGEMEGIDPPQVTDPSEAPETNNTGRQVTAPIRWPAAGGLMWIRNEWNTTPDLIPIVQTWLDTYGAIPQGATMQIWIRGDNVLNNHTVTTDDSTISAFNPTYEVSELIIQYSL